jgi:hypothetical protein
VEVCLWFFFFWVFLFVFFFSFFLSFDAKEKQPQQKKEKKNDQERTKIILFYVLFFLFVCRSLISLLIIYFFTVCFIFLGIALHNACCTGHIECVKTLVEAKSDVNVVDVHGNTPVRLFYLLYFLLFICSVVRCVSLFFFLCKFFLLFCFVCLV